MRQPTQSDPRIQIVPMTSEILCGLFHSLVKYSMVLSTKWICDRIYCIQLVTNKQLVIMGIFSFQSFLATGDSFTTLAGRFRVAISTVHAIIMTCKVIWNILHCSITLH